MTSYYLSKLDQYFFPYSKIVGSSTNSASLKELKTKINT